MYTIKFHIILKSYACIYIGQVYQIKNLTLTLQNQKMRISFQKENPL
jgi:hypothetical protein